MRRQRGGVSVEHVRVDRVRAPSARPVSAYCQIAQGVSGSWSMSGLSVAERRQLLAEQARSIVSYYEESKGAADLGGGAFIEY